MVRNILFSLVFLLTASVSFAQLSVSEEPIVLKTSTGDIQGTLKMPGLQSPVPVAIIIAGSGPTDRRGNQPMMQNNSLDMLSNGLYAQNIATVIFDKRGIAASRDASMKEEDLRFENYIDDVRAWVELLSADKRFSSVSVVGHSEGALIGLIASINNKKVARYVSLAGVGEPAGDILRWQLNKQLAAQPESLKEMIFSYLEKLERGETFQDVPAGLESLFRRSVQPYMISWMKYNPQTEMARLSIPCLIVQGTTDIQVSVEQAELLAKANPKARKLILTGVNHVLKDCDTTDQQKQMAVYMNASLPVNGQLIDAVGSFINEK